MSLSQGDVCLSCPGAVELGILFPHLAGVAVDEVLVESGRLCVWARARAGEAACPKCGAASARVHSRYSRRLSDLAAGGRRVVIRLTVRRFFCEAPGCGKRTFAEQVAGLTSRYARRTPPLKAALGAVAASLAGRAGSRLAASLGMRAGRTCMLRLLMAQPVQGPGAVRVLGVDDFAFRRGRVYGTLLIDVETGKPADLLPDREAATLARWLKDHPGTEVICRDRAGAYADGAREGAPAAIQVADRWHLWHNLAGHAEKTVARHRECLREPEPEDDPAAGAGAVAALQQAAAAAAARRAGTSPLASRTRERWEQVQALKAQGLGVKPIMRETGLAKATVRRFYRAVTIDELLAKTRDGRPSILDPHKDYLHRRWAEGCTTARQLHAEVRQQGYDGSYATVREYLCAFRTSGAVPPAAPGTPKARDITRWVLSRPDSLEEDEALKLKQARERCPHLDALARHVAGFAKILTGRHGDQLDRWIAAVEADDQPDLHSFTNGLKRDYDAVRNGLTLQWSSGAVEGNVNRLKMLKRQCYGRAGFALLRHRVLLAN